MKIVVINSTVFPTGQGGMSLPGYGGLEVIAWHCAKGLAERGHDVTLVGPIGTQCPGCEVIQCLPPGMSEEVAWRGCVWKNANNEDIKWPGYWQKIVEINDKGKEFVCIDHSWSKWVYMLKAERRIRNCKILGVMHAPIHTMINSLPPGEKPCIVCISEDQKNHFEALFSPAKARVAYNGICTQTYRPINTPRSNRFLFLARFSTIKGPHLSIEACKKAGVGLDLIGDTTITNEPDLINRCKQMADGKQIRIIGNVPRGETVWWYSQAHALLHPNQIFREPFGLSLVESLAGGCPVIGWNYGSLPEIVRHGETGWLVNSMDELTNIIKTVAGNIPDRIRDRCKEWSQRFSLENMVSRYEELCQEAIETGGW